MSGFPSYSESPERNPDPPPEPREPTRAEIEAAALEYVEKRLPAFPLQGILDIMFVLASQKAAILASLTDPDIRRATKAIADLRERVAQRAIDRRAKP